MNILFISPFELSNKNDSSGIFSNRQIESLRKNGVICEIYTFRNRLNIKGFVVGVREIRHLAKIGEYDLIHAQYGSLTGLGAILAGFNVAPVIISFCGSDLNGSPDVSRLRSYISVLTSQLAALGAKGIICKSDQLRKKLVLTRSRSVVIPNGVNIENFYPMERDLCRKRLKLNGKTTYILFNNGNNDPVKREDIANEVVREYQKQLGNKATVKLLVLRNIAPNEVVYFINAADALIITSENEGSPNILKEAIACQLPVVSFDVGDAALHIAQYSYGRIVERNVATMVSTLQKLLFQSSPKIGAERSRLSFDDKIIASKIMQYYSKIIR